MLKKVLGMMIAAALVVSCSNPSSNVDTADNATALEAPSRSSNTEAESDLLLARKWQSEGGILLIDLSLNGNFVGEIEGQPIQGTWKTSEDGTQLLLSEDQGIEGKGKALQQSYTIVSNSADQMVLQDNEGKQWILLPLD